jgi:2-deoxy-D-gluconate 3-dehydrogenase
VNLNSLFVICQAAGRHFIPRKSGNIINIASLNSYIGGSRVVSYSAAKGAVATVTKALSNEWSGHNIRVNAIAPGSIATDMWVHPRGKYWSISNTAARQDPAFTENRLNGIPGGRWGAPEDFMGPAVFLASDASAYITGETLVVDGVSLLLERRPIG